MYIMAEYEAKLAVPTINVYLLVLVRERKQRVIFIFVAG